jgi:hypothetical protein
MSSFRGTIIKESLSNRDILNHIKIISTEIEEVTDKHQTPWVRQWTLYTVEIPESEARSVAEEIESSIDIAHDSWYVDYRNDNHHYIIYSNKIFYIDRRSKEQYDEARRYGISLGIPEYQVNFSRFVVE